MFRWMFHVNFSLCGVRPTTIFMVSGSGEIKFMFIAEPEEVSIQI